MPALTIDVPPDHRDDLLRELLRLYSLKAEAVHRAADDYLSNERSLDPLLDHRVELTLVDSVIEQVGWRLNEPSRAVRLTGDRHLLAEISRGALHNAVSDLAESLADAGAGPRDVEAVGRSLRRANGLFNLLRTVYRPAPSPA